MVDKLWRNKYYIYLLGVLIIFRMYRIKFRFSNPLILEPFDMFCIICLEVGVDLLFPVAHFNVE